MYKVWASIRKEFLQLVSDKVGLTLMFVMPLLLVFIITIIQDSAYKLVNENKISVLISNQDKGNQGERLAELLGESGLFDATVNNKLDSTSLKKALLDGDELTALYIPENFTEILDAKASKISGTMLAEFDLGDESIEEMPMPESRLDFYHDPILQENYSYSVMNMISSFMDGMESELMIEKLFLDMGAEGAPEGLKKQIMESRTQIRRVAATSSGRAMLPNSTQHNVPAWTLFAMFFMVVSLGNNVVREKVNGSFLRLRTMPSNIAIVFLGKMFVYTTVAVLQVTLIFSIGSLLFPMMELPELVMPSNFFAFGLVILLCGLAAVSYAMMIGALAKTPEQANGVGAVSIVIFSAIGGIWVPTFVMPEFLQQLSKISPLSWCLEGFYILFLKDGSFADLMSPIFFLLIFILSCFAVTFGKLKLEKLI